MPTDVQRAQRALREAKISHQGVVSLSVFASAVVGAAASAMFWVPMSVRTDCGGQVMSNLGRGLIAILIVSLSVAAIATACAYGTGATVREKRDAYSDAIDKEAEKVLNASP